MPKFDLFDRPCLLGHYVGLVFEISEQFTPVLRFMHTHRFPKAMYGERQYRLAIEVVQRRSLFYLRNWSLLD